MLPLERLERALSQYRSILVGYSGGVDSALLAVVARRALGRGRMLAAIGRSPSLAEAQWGSALDLARRFDFPLLEVRTDEFSDPDYTANPTNRCYFCKTELWSTLFAVARERGIEAVLDGTNADDLTQGGHRPGFRAGREWGVRSPLADLNFTKDLVRRVARELGIPIWNAPAAPCLSSRLKFGLRVTAERVRQVELAEAMLRELGVRGDMRVRHLGDLARIEVLPEEQPNVRAAWAEIESGLLALGFAAVELDPRGYRRGAMIQDAIATTCGSLSR